MHMEFIGFAKFVYRIPLSLLIVYLFRHEDNKVPQDGVICFLSPGHASSSTPECTLRRSRR